MTALLVDSFDEYTSSSDLGKYYWTRAAGWSFNPTGGRFGGGAAVTTASQQTLGLPATFTSVSNVGVSGMMFWIQISAPPSGLLVFVNFLGSGLASAGFWGISTVGKIGLYNTGSGLLAGGNINICDGNWHFLQGQFNSNGAGNFMQVDGYNILEWNSAFTPANNPWTNVSIQSASNGNYALDDYVFLSGDGIAPASGTLYGPQLVTHRPMGADSAISFTPDSGSTNYTQIDEATPDEDGSYVQNNNSGQADEYTAVPLGFAPATVVGVFLTHRVKNPGAGAISFRQRVRSGATLSDSAAIITPSSYQMFGRSLGVDPNTNAAWTGPNIDAAKWGQVVV